ncbi:DUF6480 family protein [Streptomyces sp. NPDC001020]
MQISREIRARCEALELLVADAVGNERRPSSPWENTMAQHHDEKPPDGLSVPEVMAPGAAPPAESGVSELGPHQEAPRRTWRPGAMTPFWVVMVRILLLLLALAIFKAVG